MTSSIFLPRSSRAWPEPNTHLIESTMLVLPEPLGPTIAVTPPSKRISVGRANVLKPSRFRERRNKLALGYQRARRATRGDGGRYWGRLDLGYNMLILFEGFAELAAPPRGGRCGLRHRIGRGWRACLGRDRHGLRPGLPRRPGR